jgi:hypothetical protein
VTTSVNGWFDQPLYLFNADDARNQHWLQASQDADQSLITFVNRKTGWVVTDIYGVLSNSRQLLQAPDPGGGNQRWIGKQSVNDLNAFVLDAANGDGAWTRIVVISEPFKATEVVWITTENGAASQAWKFDSVVVQNTFRISSVESGLYLGIDGYSGDNVNITQLGPDLQAPLGLNLVWTLEDLGGGLFRIRSVTSDSVWDVNPAEVDVSSIIRQFPENNGINQTWSFQDLGTGAFKIRPGSHTKFVLDLAGGSHDPGTPVQQFPEDAGNAPKQQWRLEPFDF